jgi:hypothetical protein
MCLVDSVNSPVLGFGKTAKLDSGLINVPSLSVAFGGAIKEKELFFLNFS